MLTKIVFSFYECTFHSFFFLSYMTWRAHYSDSVTLPASSCFWSHMWIIYHNSVPSLPLGDMSYFIIMNSGGSPADPSASLRRPPPPRCSECEMWGWRFLPVDPGSGMESLCVKSLPADVPASLEAPQLPHKLRAVPIHSWLQYKTHGVSLSLYRQDHSPTVQT